MMMLGIAVYWLFTGVGVLGGAPVILLFLFSLIAILYFKFPVQFATLYRTAARYKWFFLLLVVVYQVLVVLATNLMIRSDAAMVFNGAMKIVDDQTISLYLSRYPNNLLLFLYERFFYKVFGMQAIWVMQVLNILYATVPAIVLYGITKKHFNQRVADATYFFYLFFLGFSPQFVTVYTDIMVIPVIVLQLHFMMKLFYVRRKQLGVRTLDAFFLALFTALGFLIRPTLVILPMAVFMVQFFRTKWKEYFLALTVFLFAFILSYMGMRRIQHNQTEVTIHHEYSITALAYIDLGLTYIGTDQIDFQNGLSLFVTEDTKVDEYYDGRFSNQVVMKDIQRRLKAYTPSTFIGHVLTKQAGLMRDGTLGWVYKDASQEGAYFINPLYERLKDNNVLAFIRQYLIYMDQPTYTYYRHGIQLIYLVLIIGFVLQFFYWDKTEKANMLALAVFGGLLFLMIFEGGKARYLVQFLPQILILSSLGYDRFLSRKREMEVTDD